MKVRVIGYWVCTGLIAFSFLSGGVVDLWRPSFALEGMTHLGYPAYFMIILGFWKGIGRWRNPAAGLAPDQGVGLRGHDLRPDRSFGLALRRGRRPVSHRHTAGSDRVGRRVVGAASRGR